MAVTHCGKPSVPEDFARMTLFRLQSAIKNLKSKIRLRV
jgi:hypothetical protein